MISFALTDDQDLARDTFHVAARDLLRNAGQKADEARSIPRSILSQAWDLGLLHVQGAESRDSVLNAVVLEELGWGDAAITLSLAGTAAVVQAVEEFGTAEQQAVVLSPLLGGSSIPAAIAITEPGFDFDVTEFATSARRDGDDYILQGCKSFVPMAADCAFFLVLAQSDGVATPFVVPRDTLGVVIEPTDTLGLRALEFGKVKFDAVKVGSEMRLGGDNGCDTQRIIDSARVGTAAVLNGLSRAIYDYVKDYTRERVAHGSALAQKQSVGFRLVDMHIGIESMRWMNWKAASEIAARSGDVTRSARLAYIYACEQTNWIADEGVQLLGGHGFLRDHPIEHWFRAARTLSTLEGLASV